MHGFIVVCDVTNLKSVRQVEGWLSLIESRAMVTEGRQVMVLVNKMDTLGRNTKNSVDSGVMRVIG